MLPHDTRNGRSTPALDLIEDRVLRTLYGDVHELLFRYQEHDVIALKFGADCNNVLVRVHSTCFSAHYLASIECDCREQLGMTMSAMQNAGSGVIVFLDQDGRGNGHAAPMRSAVTSKTQGLSVGKAYELLGYPRDARDYSAAGLVLRYLGTERARLLTNNPEKVAALTQAGIAVEEVETVVSESEGPWLADYYRLKASEGHRIPGSWRA